MGGFGRRAGIQIEYRDNYNSLTSAKLPPKNEDGQLKSICADKGPTK